MKFVKSFFNFLDDKKMIKIILHSKLFPICTLTARILKYQQKLLQFKKIKMTSVLISLINSQKILTIVHCLSNLFIVQFSECNNPQKKSTQ